MVNEIMRIIKTNVVPTIDNRTYIIDSSLLLDQLEKISKISLEKEIKDQINTVGGLVFYLAGKIPAVGEKFDYKNKILFEIIDVLERRINKIKIVFNN